ncbi:MAG: 50S ribosomal protein L4 [Planctomycetota bacterium]
MRTPERGRQASGGKARVRVVGELGPMIRQASDGKERHVDVTVYNMQGQEAGSVSIDTQSLEASPINNGINPDLIKQAYVRYHGNLRQGSARNKSRGQVAYSTRKLYKQKGTGRARHGSRKVPIMRGGGVTFSKTRDREAFRKDMPVKMRRKANRNALLAKLLDSEVKVIDKLTMDTPKTKNFLELYNGLGLDRSVLVVTSMNDEDEGNTNVALSARNFDDARVVRLDQMTTFELLNHRYVIISKSDLEAWIVGPSSQTSKAAKIDPMGRGEPREKKPAAPRGKKTQQAEPAAAATPAEGGEG